MYKAMLLMTVVLLGVVAGCAGPASTSPSGAGTDVYRVPTVGMATKVGYVDASGDVYSVPTVGTATKVGYVDPGLSLVFGGGAALLLLLT